MQIYSRELKQTKLFSCYTNYIYWVATRTQIELRSTKRWSHGLSEFLKFPSSILAVTRITNFIRSKICFIQCHVTYRFPTYSHADPIIWLASSISNIHKINPETRFSIPRCETSDKAQLPNRYASSISIEFLNLLLIIFVRFVENFIHFWHFATCLHYNDGIT